MTCLPNLDGLPIEIRESTRAVVCQFEDRNGKATKVPYQAHWPTRRASVTDPSTWARFDEAFVTVESGKADGCGIVLGDGLIGIDLDHCRDAETGEMTPASWRIIRALNSYTEISVSGTGLHVYVKGTLPPGRRHTNGLEIYDAGRYFVVTGQHLADTPTTIEERTPQLGPLHAEWFGVASVSSSSSWSRPVRTTSLDDTELLTLAHRASNGDTFTRLWSGDTSGYNDDESAADLALCNLLAFWTERDAERMDRLFRQSGLMRPKWDSPRRDTTYGSITIQRAIADCTETYAPAIEVEIDDDSPDVDPAPAAADDRWPQLHPNALVGLFGDLVRTLAPHTEADPVALLLHTLVLFGSVVGRTAHMPIGADRHYLNENVLVIGDTSTGRKGTALAETKLVMADVDPIWAAGCVVTGLSSGEGVIRRVCDAITKQEAVKVGARTMGYERVTVDPGVTDKRLAVIEPEFSRVMRASRRDGNTLSPIIRQAWDDGTLNILTKDPVTATGAHISIIGHCTPLELHQELRRADMGSGFANRFLIALVRRSQYLPEGGAVDTQARAELVARFQRVVVAVEQIATITRNDEARRHWREVYPWLTRARPGLIGAVCNRAPAHVARLACLYALADASAVITLEHQKAALAVWRYCETSATKLFGQRTGNQLADFLLKVLRAHPAGRTRTELSDALGRHRRADELNAALELLVNYGLAYGKADKTKLGRPAMRWFATQIEAHDVS